MLASATNLFCLMWAKFVEKQWKAYFSWPWHRKVIWHKSTQLYTRLRSFDNDLVAAELFLTQVEDERADILKKMPQWVEMPGCLDADKHGRSWMPQMPGCLRCRDASVVDLNSNVGPLPAVIVFYWWAMSDTKIHWNLWRVFPCFLPVFNSAYQVQYHGKPRSVEKTCFWQHM